MKPRFLTRLFWTEQSILAIVFRYAAGAAAMTTMYWFRA